MKKLNRILVVDDDRITTFITRQLLEDMDITKEITVLYNGQEALDYIIQECVIPNGQCIDFIILDHHMPVMDGEEFMKKFNQITFKGKENIKILLMGAHSTKLDFDKFMKLGVHDCTDKPLSTETIWDIYNRYWAEKSSI